MPQEIVIVDYGMGNLHSVKKKLSMLNCKVLISCNKNDIFRSDKLVLPGVGHFQKAMQNLHSLNLIEVLNESVVVKKKPILGICLGMQLMADKSEEGYANGFGWIAGEVIKFKVKNSLKYKIPHVGWNQINIKKSSNLMKNIDEMSEFYFVHSYHFQPKNSLDILNVSEYENKFVSAVEKNNIFGVQYHPEKSHDVGKLLLNNFINL